MNIWTELKRMLAEQPDDPSDAAPAELYEQYRKAPRASLEASTISYVIGNARMRLKAARLLGHELNDSELRALVDDPPRELFPKAFERRAAERAEETRLNESVRGTEEQRTRWAQNAYAVDPGRRGEQR